MVFIYCFAATLADLGLMLAMLIPSVIWMILFHLPIYILTNVLIMLFWELSVANFRSILVYTLIAAMNSFFTYYFLQNRELKRFY